METSPTQPAVATATTDAEDALAAGLVDRAIDPQDRRVHRVAVSPAGARLLARHRKQKNAFLERRLRKLSDDDRAVLRRAAVIMEELTR